MKKSRIVTGLSVAAFSLLLAACGSSGGSASDSSEDSGKVTKITVATGNDALPYAYLDENGKYDGYDVAVVKAIDKKLKDYSFTFEGSDFPTTLSNLESNKAQMAAYEYEVNDERKEKFVYGDVGYVVWDTYISYDPDKGETYNTFDDLKGKKVYVTTSTNQAAMAENYLKDHPDAFTLVYGEYSNEQIVQALTSGAVDATLAPKYQIDNYNKTFDVHLNIGDKPVHNSDAYLLFNKKTDTKLIEEVNKALKELKEDGTIKKLSEKYLDGDYVPKD